MFQIVMARMVLLMALSSIAHIAHTQILQLQKEVNKIIGYDTELDFNLTPASVIGVIDQDSVFIFTIGLEEEKDSLDATDIFEVGSITKGITIATLKLLEKNGLVVLHDKVNNYLPQYYRNPRLDYLTIYDLINHYGGFSRLPKMFGSKQKNIQDPYAFYTKEDVLLYYRDFLPTKEQINFEYSHYGYALLEPIIENVTGLLYEDAVKIWLLDPLEMDQSYFTAKENKSIVQGYNRAMRKVEPRTYRSFRSSESLKTSAQDLCKFIQASLKINETPISDVLYELLQIQETTSYNDKIKVGNGWHVVTHKNKYPIYTLTGKTSGHAAFLAMVKETKTGVFILSNSETGTRDLGFLILRMVNDNWNRKI